MTLNAFLNDAREWSTGKLWQPRALLIVICSWIFYKQMRDPLYGGIAKGLNLGIHEMGHVFFGFFGIEFLMVAGGTIMQLLAPLAAFWMFYRQRDYFAIGIASCWLGTNFFDIAAYMSDARAQELPLVSIGGGDPEHDWYFMLSRIHLLDWDTSFGALVRATGAASFLIGLALCFWLVRQMRLPNEA